MSVRPGEKHSMVQIIVWIAQTSDETVVKGIRTCCTNMV